MATGTGLLTDHYELTMLQAALRDGTADRRCVFELFGRRLPAGRRYGVVAGTGRFLEALERFTFDREAVAFLRGLVDDRTCDWLAAYRFSGDVWGYPEGECYFPGSPLLVVEATFGEAVLLETLALSILNHDSAVASAAARMSTAADGRPIIEMGSRRTHEWAAVAAARAAYIGGFASTSNLEAGRRYGIPTQGTSSHAFTLLHDRERDAFDSQVAALGTATTLLVDTYDVPAAVRSAVAAAGPGLRAVRIDSGDLRGLARQVRTELDELGARDTGIVVSGDLDEYALAGLAAAPVDGYGLGTALVTGSGAPTAELVYKLVARAGSNDPGAPLVGVAKTSTGKPTHKGRKWAFRAFGSDGVARAEVVSASRRAAAPELRDPDVRASDLGESDPGESDLALRPLLCRLVEKGAVVGRAAGEVAAARDRRARSVAELPAAATQLSGGDPAIPTWYEGPTWYESPGDRGADDPAGRGRQE